MELVVNNASHVSIPSSSRRRRRQRQRQVVEFNWFEWFIQKSIDTFSSLMHM